MIEITATDTQQRIFDDYKNNFMPRVEIGIKLSPEQMLEVLRGIPDIDRSIRLTPHVKFYLQKLFTHSFEALHKELSIDAAQKYLTVFKNAVQFDKSYEIKSLVVLIELTFFPSGISDYHLHQIYHGLESMDIHCMHLAYNIRAVRSNKGGVDFDAS